MERILTVFHPNEAMATIQTTSRLCEHRYYFSPPADEELSKEFIALREEIQGIHGTVKVEIGRHDIHVERYEVFEWDEIIPKIIDALKKYTGVLEYNISIDDQAEKYRNRKNDNRIEDDFND